MPQTTKKKNPDRTKGRPFAFPDQANKSFNCNKAETERHFINSSGCIPALIPVDVPDELQILAFRMAMRLSGCEKDVI